MTSKLIALCAAAALTALAPTAALANKGFYLKFVNSTADPVYFAFQNPGGCLLLGTTSEFFLYVLPGTTREVYTEVEFSASSCDIPVDYSSAIGFTQGFYTLTLNVPDFGSDSCSFSAYKEPPGGPALTVSSDDEKQVICTQTFK